MAGPEPGHDAEIEEMYSSWSLFIVCMLLILSLWTSYYLQIKRIRAVHETVVSIFAGMFVGLLVRIGPAHMIRDMLVSRLMAVLGLVMTRLALADLQAHAILQLAPTANHPQLGLRAAPGMP